MLARWQSLRRVPAFLLPGPWRDWVLDNGSLTKRLIEASGGDFRVNLVHLKWGLPHHDEALALTLPPRQWALIREVELICRGEVWVCARSVIPASTLTGAERQMLYLGNKPLGAFLFSSLAMSRGPLEIAPMKPQAQRQKSPVWARRSVFRLHQKPLLVTESFMPQVIDALPRH